MSADPSDADVLLAALLAGQARIRTATIARVESYDRATRSATVRPVNSIATQVDGVAAFVAAPAITSVPVSFQLFTFDLAAGASVLVVFLERSHDEWRSQGSGGHTPIDRRMHDATDAIAIPLLYAPGGAQPADAVAEGAAVALHPDIRLGGASATDFVALASLVLAQLSAITTAFNLHVHGTGIGPTTTPIVPMAAPSSVAATTTKAL